MILKRVFVCQNTQQLEVNFKIIRKLVLVFLLPPQKPKYSVNLENNDP